MQKNQNYRENILELIDIYGGSSENYGFTISSSLQGTIVGFTLTGTTIPTGLNTLLITYKIFILLIFYIDLYLLCWGRGGSAFRHVHGAIKCSQIDWTSSLDPL